MRLASMIVLLLTTAPALAAPFDVGRYESTGLGPVNTWWIETPGAGLVVFDSGRSADQAAVAAARIRATGKPVRAILLTHPHPDHVGGVATLRAAFPGVPVIAQAGTRDEMREDTQKLLGAGGAPLPPAPDRVAGEEALVIDGLRIEPHALGAGESIAQTVYFLPQARILISADLATPAHVPYLKEGHTTAWLAELAILKARYPARTRLLPGHGPDGELTAMADAQTAYLTAYRDGIARAIRPDSPGGQVVTTGERQTLAAEMARRFGTGSGVAGMPIEKLDAMNAAGVAAEMGAPQPAP